MKPLFFSGCEIFGFHTDNYYTQSG